MKMKKKYIICMLIFVYVYIAKYAMMLFYNNVMFILRQLLGTTLFELVIMQ